MPASIKQMEGTFNGFLIIIIVSPYLLFSLAFTVCSSGIRRNSTESMQDKRCSQSQLFYGQISSMDSTLLSVSGRPRLRALDVI